MNVSLPDLLIAGSHFGHLTRRWNPKMKKYIFMERNGIYVIDLKKTLECLKTASQAIIDITKSGERILFVGTKKQAKDIIKNEAERSSSYYINERWLGGTLTNYTTIKKSVRRMKHIEKMATDGTYDKLLKKEILKIEREREKLDLVLGGIRDMNKLPGAMFVVDTKKETIAVAEAIKLNIPLIAIVDTNCDPEVVDYPIPANDDAFKSVSLITRAIADAVLEGMSSRVEPESEEGTVEVVPESTEAPKDEVIVTQDAGELETIAEKIKEVQAAEEIAKEKAEEKTSQD
ncbi:30S ribosomal protein S2 [candidate division KSB1 bacterium]|nr:30S ribosomal protein S2 [candidate division KSB1 bacterium]